MTEDFLHHIWKYRLFISPQLTITSGQELMVLDPGIHNHNAGPDFLNARIKIGDQTWFGHIEIHLRASDWHKHGHTNNEQYKNVILHVVYENDEDIYLYKKDDLPVLVVQGIFHQNQWHRYVHWLESKTWIPCERHLRDISSVVWIGWKDRLLVERLEGKTNYIQELLHQTRFDWQETFYRLVARNFGFKTNSEGMIMLADSLPQKVLARHRSDPFQVEALLFGQAGFLNGEFTDEYPNSLKVEYEFLRKKYHLTSINYSVWKMSRLRPSNFPAIRIAQLADLICRSEHLFSVVLELDNMVELQSLFKVEAHPYWLTHYRFDVEGNERPSLRIGDQSIENIFINSVAPMLFAYGQYHADEKLVDRSLRILEFCAFEPNRVMTNWLKLGVEATNAADSQSLLWLFNEYCNKKRCLSCNIGLELLKKNEYE